MGLNQKVVNLFGLLKLQWKLAAVIMHYALMAYTVVPDRFGQT